MAFIYSIFDLLLIDNWIERLEWARELEQIERLKAKERMSQGVQNFAQHEIGKTADIVSNDSGFGNKETYRQAQLTSSIMAKEDCSKEPLFNKFILWR